MVCYARIAAAVFRPWIAAASHFYHNSFIYCHLCSFSSLWEWSVVKWQLLWSQFVCGQLMSKSMEGTLVFLCPRVLVSTSLNSSSKQAIEMPLLFWYKPFIAFGFGVTVYTAWAGAYHVYPVPSSSLYNLYVYVDFCNSGMLGQWVNFILSTLYFFPIFCSMMVVSGHATLEQELIFQGRVWVIEEGVEENCWDQAEDGVAERWCWQTVRWARGEDGGMNSSMCLICYSWVEVTHTRLVLDGSDA